MIYAQDLLQVRKKWRNIWISFYTSYCISIPYGMPVADINTHKDDFCTTPYIVLYFYMSIKGSDINISHETLSA